MPPTTYPAQQGDFDRSSGTSRSTKSDEALLEKIRKRFSYHKRRWEDIWKESDNDMQALDPLLGPWDPKERQAREAAKRPCIHLDQLNQYANMLINEVRQNPIAIKVNPGDSVNPTEAAKATAEATLCGNRIRAIEYEQNATSALITAFESAVQRSFGVWGLLTEEIAWDSFEQRIKIRRFANPYAVTWDPDCKEADCSDMADAFVLNRMLISDFQEKYKDSEPSSFGTEEIALAPDWVDHESIQVAEYWYVEKKERKLYLLMDGSPSGKKMFAEDIKANDGKVSGGFVKFGRTELPILKQKTAIQREIKQCITNGIEILERHIWPGQWIPLFPVVGKEKYVRINGRIERQLESYIRGGRHGQMLYDYYKTNEAEDVGKVPQNLLIGYEGQFATSTNWGAINKLPTAYAEVKAQTDGTPANMVLPIPTIQQYQLHLADLAVGEESARRAIQAALGSYGFTKADDTNVKSGVAINMLDRQSDMGSFHFIDNFKAAVRHYGRCLDDLLNPIEDTARSVGIRNPDGTDEMIRINEPYIDENGQQVENRYRSSEDTHHAITIDTGASYQSQREEGKAYAMALAKDPNVFALIGDLVTRYQNLGPIGDQIADRLTPPQFKNNQGLPPEAMQAMQLKDQQLQALNAHAKQLEQQVIELQDKAQAEALKAQSAERQKAMELQATQAIEQAKIALEQMKLSQEAVLTEQKLKNDRDIAELKLGADVGKIEADHQHDLIVAASQQRHEILIKDKELDNEKAKNTVKVDFAQMPAPVFHISPPAVSVNAVPPKRTKRIHRDAQGNITHVTEEGPDSTPETPPTGMGA